LGQSPVGCRPDSRLYGIAPTGDFPAARFHNASFVIEMAIDNWEMIIDKFCHVMRNYF
jgi:hypothetical protein